MGLTVNFSAMFDAVNSNGFGVVVNLKKDSVISKTQTIAVNPGEFNDPVLARFFGKGFYFMKQIGQMRFWKGLKIFRDMFVIKKGIQGLQKALFFKLFHQGFVGDSAHARIDSPFQIKGIFQFMDMLHEALKIGHADNNGLCASLLID